jgi:hypothetical protein
MRLFSELSSHTVADACGKSEYRSNQSKQDHASINALCSHLEAHYDLVL